MFEMVALIGLIVMATIVLVILGAMVLYLQKMNAKLLSSNGLKGFENEEKGS